MQQVVNLEELKPLTKEAVRLVSNTLMNHFGSTTTLEVKNALRASDYIAIQADISEMMNELCEEEDWYYDCNGTFRTYRKTYPFGDGRMVLLVNPN